MNYSDNVISLIESIVDQMTPTITITSNVDNGGSSYTLEACQTYWVHKLMKLTIDGVEYTVTDFVLNTSITISGVSQPVVTLFQLVAPEFKHGTHRKVESERAEQLDVSLPRVYLPVPTVKQDGSYDTDIAYRADIRPLFLLNFDPTRDTTALQQTEVIEPANEMADLFYVICEEDDRFEDPENLSRKEWMNFGDETIWGNDEAIFDQPLSGVELKFTLEVLIDSYCECADMSGPDLCPDVTTSVESVDTGVDTAAGQNIDIQVVDTGGVTVPSTLTENTANVKKLEVNTSGSPASNQVNGAAKTDIPAGGSKDFVIQDGGGTPVTVSEVSDSATEFVGEVTLGATYFLSVTGQETAYLGLDDGQRFLDGDYANAILTDFYTLVNVNEWGSLKRFTGDTGGYMDEATGNFFDVNNVATTKALAFPNTILRDYAYRRRWYMNRSGARSWTDSINNIGAESKGGETGWLLPNKSEYETISSANLKSPTYIDSRLFNWPAFNMWSSTTDKNVTTRALRYSSGTDTWAVATKTGTNGNAYIKPF